MRLLDRNLRILSGEAGITKKGGGKLESGDTPALSISTWALSVPFFDTLSWITIMIWSGVEFILILICFDGSRLKHSNQVARVHMKRM